MSSGATLVRAGQSVSAKPGEVLFTGDSLRAGTLSATFLFCPQKLSTTIAPGSEALLAADSFHVRTGSVQDRKQVSACFLPAVQKLSVASMQHYGVMIARSGSAPPPKTSLDERIAALPEAARQELNGELATWNAALAEDPKDLAALIARAAALDRAGLLYDLGAEPGCRDRANPGARADEKGIGAATARTAPRLLLFRRRRPQIGTVTTLRPRRNGRPHDCAVRSAPSPL
jgi:hypothetical protein